MMNNLDAPMTRRKWLLLALLCSVSAYALSEFHQYLSTRVSPPVVLNSLPATKVKCDTSAIPGYCAGKGIYENKWLEAQE